MSAPPRLPPPSRDNQKCLQMFPDVPWGTVTPVRYQGSNLRARMENTSIFLQYEVSSLLLVFFVSQRSQALCLGFHTRSLCSLSSLRLRNLQMDPPHPADRPSPPALKTQGSSASARHDVGVQ